MENIVYLLIIVTGVATILTIYGLCLMYDDLAKKSAVVGVVCGILAVALFFGIDAKENGSVDEYDTNNVEYFEISDVDKDEITKMVDAYIDAQIAHLLLPRFRHLSLYRSRRRCPFLSFSSFS